MRHFKHFVCLCFRTVLNIDDIIFDWNVKGGIGSFAKLRFANVLFTHRLSEQNVFSALTSPSISQSLFPFLFSSFTELIKISRSSIETEASFFSSRFFHQQQSSPSTEVSKSTEKCVSSVSSTRVYR